MPQLFMAKELKVGIRTNRRSIDQLSEYKLVETIRMGVRKPNRIYLNMVMNVNIKNNPMLGNRKRYHPQDYLNSLFLQLPRFLMQRYYSDLSNDSKMLYAILKDRMNLSIDNEFMHLDDAPYVIYSRQELAESFGVSRPTVIKVMKELVTYDLIEEIKCGFGDHNKIFIMGLQKRLWLKNYQNWKVD